MKSVYSCVLMGLGRIAWRFDFSVPRQDTPLTHFGAYARDKRTSVVGAFSPEPKERSDFEKSTGIPAYDSFDELLGMRPDIVSICSPSELHFEQTMACLEQNVPMVWLEKPPTMKLQDLDSLLVTRKKRGSKTKILVNYMRRYWGVYLKLKRVFDEQRLGKPLGLNISYSQGLESNCSHLLDFAFFLLGDPVTFDLFFPNGQNFEPNPSFLLRLRNGFDVCVSGFDASYHINDVALICEMGRASILSGGLETQIEMKSENELFPGFYRLTKTGDSFLGQGGFDDCFSNALDDLIASHEKCVEPISNLDTARRTQAVMGKIRDTGKESS